MADAYIPSFGLKGPEESLPKNFDASGALATVGSPTVTSYSVVVVEGGAELIIADVAYDVVTKRLSFTMAGGTVGVIYYVRCRVSGVGFKFDQTATIEVVART